MGIVAAIARKFGYVPIRPRTRRRGYDAASTGRLFSSWTTQNLSANAELKRSLKAMRARCRELEQNNDYAKRFINLCVINIVGPQGIRLQNKARDESTGKLDKVANLIIEREWERWGRKDNCTVDGGKTWYDVQDMFTRAWARDGEPILRKIFGPVNEFRFALQFIEADQLDEERNEENFNGNRISMGVELNPMGRPVAYHVLSNHPGDYSYVFSRHKYIRIPATEIIHGFIQERPGQCRGVPPMHSAMTRLNMLGGYEEAELVASRAAAAKMGAITTPSGDEFGGDDVETETGAKISDFEAGTFFELATGQDVTLLDPTHPGGNFQAFVKSVLRGVASGLGISYATLASDLEGANYSSTRVGSIDERDAWQKLQLWAVNHLCKPVFEAWLEAAMITTINLPMSKFDKFNAPRFMTRGWQWVDPLKDVKATGEALRLGLTTWSIECAKQGMDFEEVMEGQAEDKAVAATYGIELSAEPEPTTVAAPAQAGAGNGSEDDQE